MSFHEEIGNEALEALGAIEKIVGAAPGQNSSKPDFNDLFSKLRYHPQAKELAARAFESAATAVVQASGWATTAITGLTTYWLGHQIGRRPRPVSSVNGFRQATRPQRGRHARVRKVSPPD